MHHQINHFSTVLTLEIGKVIVKYYITGNFYPLFTIHIIYYTVQNSFNTFVINLMNGHYKVHTLLYSR